MKTYTSRYSRNNRLNYDMTVTWTRLPVRLYWLTLLSLPVNYILRENSRKIVTWFRYSPWRSIFRHISNFSGTATSGIVIRHGGVNVTVIKYCETCNSTALCGISFQHFQPMWSWSTNVTNRRTDGRIDRRTDDMRMKQWIFIIGICFTFSFYIVFANLI